MFYSHTYNQVQWFQRQVQKLWSPKNWLGFDFGRFFGAFASQPGLNLVVPSS
jgi:hypothetical protein